MDISESISRARLIAQKISSKRKANDEEDALPLKKRKIMLPENSKINYVGLLIGPKGTTLKHMETQSGCKILVRGKGTENSALSNEGLHVVLQSSSQDNLDRGVSLIHDLIDNPEHLEQIKHEQVRQIDELKAAGAASSALIASDHYGPAPISKDDVKDEVTIPNLFVGLVIGKGGETIRELQLRSGAHIQIQRDCEALSGTSDRLISIRGLKDRVGLAKRLINELIDERKKQIKGGGDVDLAVPVPNDKVGLVIGRGGETIKLLQEKFDVNIQIPKGPDRDDSSIRTIIINAKTQEIAEAAQAEVYGVLTTGQFGSVAVATTTSISMVVPDSCVGLIIGKGGCTIKDIQRRSGGRIEIPPSRDPNSNPPVRTITVSGSQNGVEMIRTEVTHLCGNQINWQSTNGQENLEYGGQNWPSLTGQLGEIWNQ
eukprot:TRINITY_DN376_c0_g2_i1.p2 TRINITY_DN376_c0_g2~~TRINITY_DN376_c0_g2_i1.p2  ORF type:complete len:429 (-),score=91.57 TRINITY_DN376_c0_g2_i1:356-1642(-)